MEAVARLRNNPTSPRKMRLLVDVIRGMEVEKAVNFFIIKHIFMSFVFSHSSWRKIRTSLILLLSPIHTGSNQH